MAELVYMDSWMVILDKRAGEAVQGRTAEQKALVRSWRDRLSDQSLQPVHRIDQPVPGLLILARGPQVFTQLQDSFASGGVERTYLSVHSGELPDPTGTLTDWIEAAPHGNRSVVVAPAHRTESARWAELSYERVGSTRHHSIAQVRLKTGRHHQIRAQLSNIGCPILGDTKYGARRPMRDRGIGLLAWRLAIPHPAFPVVIRVAARFPDTAIWRAVRESVQGGSAESLY